MQRTTLPALMAAYDAFLIDQYGVLRDENGFYPGALGALAALRTGRKRAIILSNSGRSAASNALRLASSGINAGLYDHVVTSGEVAFAQLAQDTPPGTTVFEIASGALTDLPERLGLARSPVAEQAGLILVSGAATETIPMTEYRRLLAPAAAAGVPVICTNPDLIKIGPQGKLLPGAGALAALYSDLGGSVRQIGKPYPDIYAAALALLPGIARDRILCIGDSPAHDIAGARAVGLASCLVETGVGAAHGAADPPADYVMAAFAA